MADLEGWLSGRYVISRPVSEGDIGEATQADDQPPPKIEPDRRQSMGGASKAGAAARAKRLRPHRCRSGKSP